MTNVVELYREWRVGDLALVLVVVELVYYLVKLVKLIWDSLRRRYVRRDVQEWRSYKRERVIGYRPLLLLALLPLVGCDFQKDVDGTLHIENHPPEVKVEPHIEINLPDRHPLRPWLDKKPEPKEIQ